MTQNNPDQPASPAAHLWLWCPMKLEARAARRGAPGVPVSHVGMGPQKSIAFVENVLAGEPNLTGRSATARHLSIADSRVVIAGIGGGLKTPDEPGDVIVASRVLGPGDPFEFPQADQLVQALAEQGVVARTGVLHCSDHIVHSKERRELGEVADAVEMESWWLLDETKKAAARQVQSQAQAVSHTQSVPQPEAVIRVLWDTPRKSLLASVTTIWPVYKALSAAVSGVQAALPSVPLAPDRQ